MKLYSGKVAAISSEIVEVLTESNAIEVLPDEIQEVELDIASVLKEYIRLDKEITDRAKDLMAQKKLDYNQLSKIKFQLAEERAMGVGESVIEYLTSQIIEVLLHSRHVEEVYAEDHELSRQMSGVLKKHMSIEEELDLEVRKRIKNLQEGTSAYEIQYKKLLDELRKNKKL
ncbi:MAG: DUF507 family protein [Deltaproteobacteria bacterium]|nr:DUF507 family protein [Deltaproteobacteria bacterium]